jgi:hypothetical protein
MTSSAPLISAIVPVYNKGRYLEEALASLEQQRYPHIEVVLVNDGSTDDSSSVVDQMPARFPSLNIRCYHKANGGASDARNYAVERARGTFIVSMDADDLMRPGFLELAMQAVSNEGADVVYSDLELFGERQGEWIPHPFDPYMIRYDNCVAALSLYKRELWEKVGGYNVSLPFYEDWNFAIALAALGATFHKLNGKFFAYRQTELGLYHSFIRDAWEWGMPMVATAQDHLYSVDDVLHSCMKLRQMPERWAVKFERQAMIHPTGWLLKLWLGLFKEGQGDNGGALALYQEASNLSGISAWIPLYQLARLAESLDPNAALQLFHRVRTLRPDMSRHVNQVIDRLLKVRQHGHP